MCSRGATGRRHAATTAARGGVQRQARKDTYRPDDPGTRREEDELTAARRSEPDDARHDGALAFDVPGLLSVGTVDASRSNLDALSTQLGLRPSSRSGSRDLVIRYVDGIAAPGAAAVGPDALHADGRFLVFDERSGAAACIPFDRIGTRPEIVCERHVGAIPLLQAIVNLTVLANGGVALHASGFAFGGAGAVIAGWPGGGKTSALLAFAAHGATFVADDWVHVDPQRRTLHGSAGSLHLSERHLRGLPAQRARLR